MKASLASLSALALVASVGAQYISAGWTPGQKINEEPTAAVYVPGASETAEAGSAPAAAATPFSLSSLLSLDKLLTSEPAVKLFNNFGINITERVQHAFPAKLWDDRIELITDHNYKDLIVNETLTEEEEKERTWIIVISVTASGQEGVSKYLDEMFDSAFNKTHIAGDLPHVRWGRIDYLNVTYITTKWSIWQAPFLVVLRDRGQTLRFYRPHHLRLRDDSLREFLKVEGWKVTKPWSTSFAPGGSNEYIMDFMATWMTKLYNTFVIIPRWMMIIASGGIASLLIGFLHKSSGKQEPSARPQVKTTNQAKPTPAAEAVASHTTTTSAGQEATTRRTSARQRKNKK
ncbi:hypothetical protein CPB84DRAFT_1742067 [Gymnopilus junonius]|uniref:Uncharacterized protein n=1 Tax=Gymnopilus junonius TaxID=109634 RepID=A0A9P5P2B1_GYMJU|nr:hypothetical protein CPB84DRAFT_1742067 [Gymnopilus junonius]